MLINAAIQLIMGLAEGLITALPILIEKGPILISKLVQALIDNAGSLAYAAGQLIVMLAVGLVKCIPTLIKSVPSIVKALFDAFTAGFQAVGIIGANLVAGLWNGIQSAWSGLTRNVKNLASGLLDKVKGVFGIHSPSREFKYIGKMCVAGMDDGMDGFGDSV
ncbi:MAG: hypothetical protein ACLVFG_11765 [Lachnospiraceae bacterium]